MHGPSDLLLNPSQLALRRDFALGPVLVSPAARRVVGPGGTAVVEPRVMQVLVALADDIGTVVTRDTLFRRCWGGVYVGDDSLNRAIAEVRRLARSVAGNGFAIQTIPRTGYRLTVAVPAAPAPGDEIAAEPLAAPSRRLVIAAGAVAAAAAGAGVLLVPARPDPRDEQLAALLAQGEQALRSGLPDSDAQGVGFHNAAVALAPGNAAAWGQLALARTREAEYAPPARIGAAVAGVENAARRALAIDPRQPDALAARALLPPYFGDWFAAERRLRSVLAVAPDHLPTLDALAFLHVGAGRMREGAGARLRFAARAPLDATHQYRLVYAQWILGRIDAADRTAERAAQLWPRHPAVWFARLWTLGFTGRATRALAHLGDTAARPDLPPSMLASLVAAMAALASRRPADIARAADAVVAEIGHGPSLAINALLVLAALGEIDRAFAIANAYFRQQGPAMASVRWRPGQFSVNDQRRRKTQSLFVPVSAPLRADPRFAGLVEAIGLGDYWRAAGVVPDFRRG